MNTMIFKPEEMLGIVDLKSLGYYKIKQGILQQNVTNTIDFKGQIHFVSISINL